MNLSKLKKALHLEVISSRKSSTSADQSHSNRKSSLKASSNRRNTIESLLSSDLEEKNFKSFVYVKKSVGVSGIRIWKKRILILEKSERILKIYKPAPNQELNSRSTFAMRQLKNNLEGKDDIESVYSDELLESTIDLRNEIHVDLMSKKKEGRRFDLVIYSIVKNVSEDVKITSTHTENVNDNEKNTNAITYSFLCAEEKAAKWWVIQISSLISPQENQLSSPQAVRLKYIFHNVENDNDSGPSLTPIIPRRHPRPSLRMSSSGSLKQMIQRSSTSVSPTKSQKEVTKFSRRSLLGSKYAQLMRKALNEMTPFHRTIWKFLNTIRMLYNSQYRAKKFFLKQKELEVGSRRFSKSTTMNLEMSFLDSDDVVGIKDSKSNTNALEFEAENLALSDSDSEDDSIKPLTDEFDISCSLSTMPKFLKLSGIEPKLIYSLMVVELRKTARCFYDDYPANSATVKSKVQSKDYPFLLCFTGKEFHDWIVRDCHQSENEAFEVGSHLLQHQIFQRVQDIDKFDKSTEYSSSEDVFYVILEYPESDQRQILENIDTSDNLYDFKSLRYQSLDVFQQMEIWVHQMRSPNGGVPLETNKKGLKYNYSSFTGRVALEWLVFGMKAIHGLTTATAFLSELLYRGSIINAFDTNCKVFRSRDVYFFNNESKDFSSTLHLFSECSSKSFRKFVLSLSSDSQVIYLMLRHLNNEKNDRIASHQISLICPAIGCYISQNLTSGLDFQSKSEKNIKKCPHHSIELVNSRDIQLDSRIKEKISMLVKVLLNTGDKFSGLLKRVFQENDAKTCSLALDLYWEILKKSVFSTHFCDNSLNCEICTRGFDAFQQFVLENCSGPRYSAYIRNSLTSMLLDKKWSMYKPVAMSQSVICPGVWKSYFSAMKGVTDESLIKQSLMDVSSLLIENSDNWSDLAKQENWPMWIFELTIPDFESMSITNLAEKKRPNKVIVDISEVQKLSLNVITLILNRKMFQTWTFIHDLRLIFSKIRCIFHLDKEKIWIISALVMNALLKRASFDFESSKPDCSSSVYWQNLKFELKIFDLITFMPDLWSSISVDNEIRVKHENASQFTKFAFRNSAFRDALLIILRSMIHFLKCFKHDRNAGIFKSKDSVLDGKKETFISRISEFYVGVVDLLEKEHIELDSKEYLSMLEQSIHTLRLKLYPESRKIFVKKIK